MTNEIALLCQLLLAYGMVFGVFILYGQTGLLAWNVFSVVVMNIEVQMQITAFGLNMTLGNILFATTFLVTDILSELYGKKSAEKCVKIGIITSVLFIVMTQLWFQFIPNEFDYICPALHTVFNNTPRIIFASLAVYAIVQKFDVWAYHKWWEWTTNIAGDKDKYLWLRNNFSTLISQALNAFLFTYIAFYGIMENLFTIAISTYIFSVVLAILDTPVIYACRKWHKKHLGVRCQVRGLRESRHSANPCVPLRGE
ncbi:MAG: queuosine precursor transporter, partial [Acidaminococcaceae bacterium]|nr:queuosine precursor transporter [Acidaminococcaceae bacterium]